MADEARLNDLLDLVEQARKEGDKDTEAKATAAYKRESAPARPVAPAAQPPSLGSFRDPYAYFKPEVQRSLGNTGEGLQPVVGVGEAALQFGTGLGASAAGGLAGIGQGAWNSIVPKRFEGMPAADRLAHVQGAMTYQPRTNAGQIASQAVSDAFDPNVATSKLNPLTWPGVVGRGLGDTSEAIGLPPSVSTVFRTLPEALLPWAARKGAEVLSASRATQAAKPIPKPIPTTAELGKATTAAYERANGSGALVSANKFSTVADEIAAKAKSEAVDPVLHPKTSRLVQILQERKGQDLTLQEAENIRRIGLEAENDVNQIGKQTADGMRAGKIVDALDEKIDELSVNDAARALNRRKMNSQTLDLMIERATNNAGAHYTQAGMEHALRLQFKQLANNPTRMNRFNAEQKAAIQKVVRGGPVENTLRGLGKFDPTAGVVPFIAGTASGGTMMLPGFLARRAATRVTSRNVDAAREALVGRGLPDAAPMPVSGAGASAPAGAIPDASGSIGGSRPVPEAFGVPDQAFIEAYLKSLQKKKTGRAN